MASSIAAIDLAPDRIGTPATQRQLSIFADVRQCVSASLTSLSPVLEWHWKGLSIEDRSRGLANPLSPFSLVNEAGDADVFVLPYEWNYYLYHNRVAEAQLAGERASNHGRKLLVWFRGDLPPVMPIPNAMLFKCAMHRSRRTANEYAAPYFIEDPIPKHGSGGIWVRPKAGTPTIGFCGYGALNPVKVAHGAASNLIVSLRYLFGASKYKRVPLLPGTVLRAKAIRNLSRATPVETDFIVRKKYRAGLGTRQSPELDAATSTFYQNILGSDYTLCVRGNGNWSIRFYETLACGRIPVFVDTDCVLPFDSTVDWTKYCVWVDQREISSIAEKVASFHSGLSAEEFVNLQIACRQLWEERLSLSGFMTHLSEFF